MKWFKHISDSADDPFIEELIFKFGYFGYAAFFIIIEVYAREFKPEPGWKLSCTLRHLMKKMQLTRRERMLNFLSSPKVLKKWDVVLEGDEVIIFIPKFLELLDETTLKKLRALAKKTGTKPEQNRTKDVDKDKDKDKDKRYSPNSDEFRLSSLLYSLILKRNTRHKKPDIQKWAYHIEKTIQINKRTPDEIEKVIKWCQKDDFWQNNILSTEKLRKQFDTLYLKMNERSNDGKQLGTKSTKSTKYAGIGKTN